MTVPGWPAAFRGSHAVAAGLVTRGRLRGPRFLRLLPDVYCRAAAEPPDLLLRSLAAYRLVEGRGVLSGHSAAACSTPTAHPAVTRLPRSPSSAATCVRIRAWWCAATCCVDDEITHVRDVACTTPLRTAFDLARGADLDEAVVAVDRLANRHRFHPDRLLDLHARYRGRRGVARVPAVVALASPYAGSPMETRLRLLIVAAGLPPPEVQWVVQDAATRTAFWLDLAWPERSDRYRVRGRAAHRTGPGAARHRPPHPAGRPGLAGLPLHQARVYGDRARIVAELARARARCT